MLLRHARGGSLIIVSDLVEALQIKIETLSWCGGKSNLYSTSLNPFTGEREEKRKKVGGAERVSVQRSGKEKAAGEGGTESDGKINRVAGKT